MIKHWLRNWLGITDLSVDVDRVYNNLHDDLILLRSDLAVTFGDENSPLRKEMSQVLGKRMIEKLSAEDKARKHTLGEL